MGEPLRLQPMGRILPVRTCNLHVGPAVTVFVCSARKAATVAVMSALPPKADMCSALADVRFVPIADISNLPSQRYRFGKNSPNLGRK